MFYGFFVCVIYEAFVSNGIFQRMYTISNLC